MKAEFYNHPIKGMCILISDFSLNDVIKMPQLNHGGIFSNPQRIADEISMGRKIPAIKEVREQTGWGLREAKEYIDQFFPMGLGRQWTQEDYDNFALKFIRAHMPNDFLDEGEMTI